MAGDFGGRLGRHMINALLPGEAEVHHLTFRTLGAGARQLRPRRARHRQRPVPAAARRRGARHRLAAPRRRSAFSARNSRELIAARRARSPDRPSRHLVRALRGRRADLRARPQQCRSPRRLADRPVPARRGRPRRAVADQRRARQELALDRAIHTIQQHKQVYSTGLRALLCALTSAELAAYAEQPAAECPACVPASSAAC